MLDCIAHVVCSTKSRVCIRFPKQRSWTMATVVANDSSSYSMALPPVDAQVLNEQCQRIIWTECANTYKVRITLSELSQIIMKIFSDHPDPRTRGYVGICVRTPHQRCHEMEQEQASHFFLKARCCFVIAFGDASFVRAAECDILQDPTIQRRLTNYNSGGGGVAGRPNQQAYLYLTLTCWEGRCNCPRCVAWQSALEALTDEETEGGEAGTFWFYPPKAAAPKKEEQDEDASKTKKPRLLRCKTTELDSASDEMRNGGQQE